MNSNQQHIHYQSPRVIALSGGKGGVGKTTLAVNLAVTLAQQNQRVMLFDADLGLANVDIMLGIKATHNISHVLSGQCTLQDICIEGPAGITIVPAASGMQKMADLSSAEVAGLIHSFSEITNKFDILLIDTAAGVSKQVMNFVQAAQDCIMVVCNDPASIADSYAMIKLLQQQNTAQRISLITNMVRDDADGYSLYLKIQKLASKFLDVNLSHLGSVPFDDYLALAAKHRNAAAVEFPGAKSVRALQAMSQSLLSDDQPLPHNGTLSFFLERIVQYQEA